MPTTLRVLGVGLDAGFLERLGQRLSRARPLLHVAPGLGAASALLQPHHASGRLGASEARPTPAGEMPEALYTANPAHFSVMGASDLEAALPVLVKARNEGAPFSVVVLAPQFATSDDPYVAAARVWSVDHGVGIAQALSASAGEPAEFPDKLASELAILWRCGVSATELAPMLVSLATSWAYSVDARRRRAAADDAAAQKSAQFDGERTRLTQVSKMVALGEMAAGVAHEINNPLTIIHGTCGLLRNFLTQSGFAADHKAQTNVTRIEATSMRIATLVRGLREFARDASADPYVEVTIDKLLEQTTIICAARLRAQSTELLLDPPPRGTRLECRESQVIHVLLNLVNNACEAVAPLGNRWVRLGAKDLGDTVELTVEDSGKGIPERLVSRIFQPYFTTKGPGKGEGLGLSVAQAVVRSHRGDIYVDRDVQTTKFVVRLPKHHAAEQAKPHQQSA
jgi:signal transduction histidine kinase